MTICTTAIVAKVNEDQNTILISLNSARDSSKGVGICATHCKCDRLGPVVPAKTYGVLVKD